jgi:hypothetical protein
MGRGRSPFSRDGSQECWAVAEENCPVSDRTSITRSATIAPRLPASPIGQEIAETVSVIPGARGRPGAARARMIPAASGRGPGSGALLAPASPTGDAAGPGAREAAARRRPGADSARRR